MAVRHGYIERIDLHVLNVVGSTAVVELQLGFAELVDEIKRNENSQRLMIDLSAARIEGTVAQLSFFLASLETTARAEGHGICVIVMDRCPLRKELVPLSDVFASKLALLAQRLPSFVVTRGRGDAVEALETPSTIL